MQLLVSNSTLGRVFAILAAAAADLDNVVDMFDGGLQPNSPSPVFTETVEVLVASRALMRALVPRPLALRYLRAALDRSNELAAVARVWLTSEYAWTLADCGDDASAKQASQVFASALAEARALGDPILEGRVLCRSARMLDYGSPELTIHALSRALTLLDGDEHHHVRARAQCTMGLAYLRGGDYQRAETALQQTLDACDGEEYWEIRCPALNNLALLNGLLGRWGESKRQLLEALDMVVPGRNPDLECVIRGNIGECSLVEGQFTEAEQWLRQSRVLAERCGYDRQFGMATGYLASLAHHHGRLDEAHSGYSEALEALARTRDDPLSEGLILTVRALADAQLGRQDDAQRGFGHAREKLGAIGDPILSKAHEIHRLNAEVAMGQRTPEDATAAACRHVEEAEKLADSRPPPHRLHQVRHAQTLLNAHLVLPPGATAIGDDRALTPAECSESSALVLVAGARELILPSGETIPLGRRPQARRIIALLAQHRIDAPGTSIDVQCLFDAGWPGDGVVEPYRSNRVYVTLTRLRNAGLEPYLLHDGEGYLLDPRQPLVVA